MSKRMTPSRREFLRAAGNISLGLGAGFALPSLFLNRTRAATGENPSEFIRVGFIGVGNQGGGNLSALLKQAVAVCDVDKTRLAAAQARVEKANTRPCAAYGDYRRLLEDKAIDAVCISTPDHWHTLPAIHACEAGKDVYCEKPLTLTIAEGQALAKVARRTKRIVQTGSQQRSEAKFRRACELIRSGCLGPVRTIVKLYVSEQHYRNWLDCIKSRKLPVCDVAIGHRSATVCHLGNIAVRTGRHIRWNPVKEKIVGDAELATWVNKPYRAPWRLPAA